MGALGLLGGCGGPAPVVPTGTFQPSTIEAFASAAARSAPARRETLRLGWRSDDGRMQLSGSGAARVAPPDSLRADIAAALGLGRATIIMIGDQAQAEPANTVDRILPDRFALWAVLGYLRVPSGAAAVERLEDGDRSVWRVTDAAGRVTIFDTRRDTLLGATREQDGRRTQELRVERGEDGAVRSARLTDYARQFRFEVNVNGREASEAFPDGTWRLRP